MEKKISEKTVIINRETWVDIVKVFACFLVALGHLFQSLIQSDIVQAGGVFSWFNTTIYYFHVPLFFICSGYLYQKYSKVKSINQWCNHIIKKAVVLVIPYIVFSTLTWCLKYFASGMINNQTEGLLKTLLIQPLSPYWYLYSLFFMFVFIPILTNRRGGA